MSLTHFKLRESFADFWQKKNHKEIPPISLVPKDDPTTLFTGSGMQPLIPYLMGESHPLGRRLYNIQPCFRSQDIEFVGDNRHTTFFEMMGNWSLGDYFKEEQLKWCLDFFTEVFDLPKEKLFITVFEGTKEVPRDEESVAVWKKLSVPEERIFYYGPEKNWWSRSGTPEQMPAGEIGGPDSEIFYDFGENLKLHEKSAFKNQKCHPNCDCGRFLEIGNSVFIQYKKEADRTLKQLPQKNVDFGGGLERILAALNNDPDVFKIDVFSEIIKEIEEQTGKKYYSKENQSPMRVIADHMKGVTFLIVNGVKPSNKEQGYILRRLLRRSAVKMYQLGGGLTPSFEDIIDRGILYIYDGVQGIDRHKQRETIFAAVNEEMSRFAESLDKGLKIIKKQDTINGKIAFDLYQSYGFPFEITQELFKEKGQLIEKSEFEKEFKKHQELSRIASVGMFKGGLADQNTQTIKYHTATHLLHQVLRDVFGNEVRQEGSNITSERLRFDFRLAKKPTDEEIKKVEEIVNQRIKEKLPVYFKMMPKNEAEKIGAASFFKEKYGDKVKVYFIGNYSKEFCGGPHVKNTSEIDFFKIIKVKKIGANLMRIYAG
jgi:alanyl-tRNA synthetase